uniref:Uncharacterized protein n=1 Tax=uncultured delta proteobacterium HF0200_14D13 TaxID=710830 RepID=E0XXV7_9DELT|nr:hypothetical protein [uncultured delta proteobacterium HF0200_14D13]
MLTKLDEQRLVVRLIPVKIRGQLGQIGVAVHVAPEISDVMILGGSSQKIKPIRKRSVTSVVEMR